MAIGCLGIGLSLRVGLYDGNGPWGHLEELKTF